MLDDKEPPSSRTLLRLSHDWGLEGAPARPWRLGMAPKPIIDKGRDWIIQRDEGPPACAGARGGAGPSRTGLKMVVSLPKESTERAGRATSSSNGRRVRARHLPRTREIMPARSASPRRGLPAGEPSRWARMACYIYVRGEFHQGSASICRAAVDQAYEAKLIGKDKHQRLAVRPLCRPTVPGRLYLRPRKPRCFESLEGKKGQPAAEEAAISRPMSASTAARPPSTMSESIAVAPDILRPRRRPGFAAIGRPQQCRHQAVFAFPAHVERPCNGRRSDGGIPFREADRETLRRHPAAAGTI